MEFGEGVRLMCPVAIGDGCRIGAAASLRDSIVFPGTSVVIEHAGGVFEDRRGDKLRYWFDLSG